MNPLLLLLLLVVTSSVKSIPRQIVTDSSTLPPTPTESSPTYDYVVEIGFNLDEYKVPKYLVNIIYGQPSEQSLTTDDIFKLYGLKTVNRTTTLEFLEKLNISSEDVFSLDGFDKFLTELRIDFKEFYNRVIIEKLNVTGNSLRNVLVTLSIDINNFSLGMAYGDPNPYDVFKKGNYTKESLISALTKADRTLDDLFIASRDAFMTKALSFSPEKIVELLARYDFDKNTALKLWGVLGLTMEDVYGVPGFKLMLNKMNSELNKIPCLGILTGPTDITINKKVYDMWSDEGDVVQPFAESITGKFKLQIIERVESKVDNIYVLKTATIEPYGDYTDYVDVGETKNDLHDCTFVTLLNDTIFISDIPMAVNHVNHIEIPRGNVTDLIPGSPLVCDGKVYGLAGQITGENIILDSFSGVGRLFFNTYLFIITITIWVYVYCL